MNGHLVVKWPHLQIRQATFLSRSSQKVFSEGSSWESAPRTENDVLTDRGGREVRSGWVSLLVAELGPFLAFGCAWVDVLLEDSGVDLTGRLDLPAGVVETVRDY